MSAYGFDYDEDLEEKLARQRQEAFNQQIQTGEVSVSEEKQGPPSPSEKPQEEAPTPEASQPTQPQAEAPSEGTQAPQREDRDNISALDYAKGSTAVANPDLQKGSVSVAQGVGDFIFDAIGLIPGAGGLKDWWRKTNPPLKSDALQAIREASSVIVPTVVGTGAAIQMGRASAMGQMAAKSAPKSATIAAEIAAAAGVDVAVTGISGTSSVDPNAAESLNNWLGWNIPWATNDEDSPDVRRKKHIMEAAGLSVGVDMLGLLFAGGGKVAKKLYGATKEPPRLKIKGEDAIADGAVHNPDRIVSRTTDPAVIEERLMKRGKLLKGDLEAAVRSGDNAAAEGIQKQLQKDARKLNKIRNRQLDPAGASVDESREMVSNVSLEKGREVLRVDPEGRGGYNAFVNDPAEPQARGLVDVEVDPIQAKVDRAMIETNQGTYNGSAAKVVDENGLTKYLEATGVSERAAYFAKLTEDLSPQVSAVKGNFKRSAQQIDAAVDNLVRQVFDTDISEVRKAMDEMKENVFKLGDTESRYLNDENFFVGATAMKRVFDEILDPEKMRASAMLTQQMGDSIAETARAANIIYDTADTSRQQEMIFEKLKVVMDEVQLNRRISGLQLQNKNLISKATSSEEMAELFGDSYEQFKQLKESVSEENSTFLGQLNAISRENPEYLRPLIEAFDATNGSVKDLYTLGKWAENSVGIIGKAFYDQNPELPSMVLQGLMAWKYNSILNGRAFIRAGFGNAFTTTLRPLSKLAGAAIHGDVADIRKTMVAYGGVTESFGRGFTAMSQEWKRVASDPLIAQRRARPDMVAKNLQEIEALDYYAEIWRADAAKGKPGAMGRLAAYELGKTLSVANNWIGMRFGTAALTSIDAFQKAFISSVSARSKAYSDILKLNDGAFNKADFDKAQDLIYRKYFSEDGQILDSAVDYLLS